MPRDRVVIVGAGVAGLVSAFALAARGLDVTVLERGAAPGGKMRQIAIGGSPDRQRARPFSPCAGCSTNCSPRRAGISPITSGCSRWTSWRATPGTKTHGSICSPTRSASVDAIGDFAGAAEADGYRAFCRDTKRIYDILEKPFLRAPQPSMGGLIGADGFRGLMRLPQIKPFSSMWSALGAIFSRSAAAPAVRPLRHLLRLVAVQGAGDPDAGRACRARRRLEHRGRHARPRHGAGRCAQDRSAPRSATAQEVSEVLIACGRAGGVRLASGERIEADAVIVNADVARGRRRAVRHRRPTRRRRRSRPARARCRR